MTKTWIRRPVLLGSGAVVILAWVGLRVLPAAASAFLATRGRLLEQVFQLERARRDLSSQASLADTVADLRRRVVSLAPRILAGSTTADAANALAGEVNLAVTRANGRLLREDPEPDSASAGMLRRVGMAVAFEGDITGVAAVLRALAENPVVCTVSRLRVLATDVNGGDQAFETLRVELTVRGWFVPRLRRESAGS